MSGKMGWQIPAGILALFTAMSTAIASLFNAKINTVEKKVDKEITDRQAEGMDQYNRINAMQKTITKTATVTVMIAQKMGIDVEVDD